MWNALAGGEGTPAPPGRRQSWVSGQLLCWSSDRDRWWQGRPCPTLGVLAGPGGLGRAHSPALATGAVVSLDSRAGQILPRAMCLALRGGRRHPLSPDSAPDISRAL